MLDREGVEEFLDSELEYLGLEVPEDIPKGALVEAFCKYAEEDYYQWLRENLSSFFNDGEPDWDWIREKTEAYEEQ